MLALSLTRPWDELILLGHKPVENRRWRTSYTGALVIHAAKSWDPEAARLATELGLEIDLGTRQTAPTGYRGVVLLTHICEAGRPGFHDHDDPCGPWAFPDQYHWRVRNPYRLDPEIPGLGGLGLRRVPASVQDAVRALTARDPAYDDGRLPT